MPEAPGNGLGRDRCHPQVDCAGDRPHRPRGNSERWDSIGSVLVGALSASGFFPDPLGSSFFRGVGGGDGDRNRPETDNGDPWGTGLGGCCATHMCFYLCSGCSRGNLHLFLQPRPLGRAGSRIRL